MEFIKMKPESKDTWGKKISWALKTASWLDCLHFEVFKP